jgi:glycosyl transferase family 25
MTDLPAEAPVFLINLDRSPDRLAEFDAQARAMGLSYERFSAVDGRAGVPEQLRAEFARSDRLSNGEVGCYASHLSIARRVVARGCSMALVLEDDAVLQPDFLECARQATQVAPGGWDIIHLSTDFKRPAYRIAHLDCGRALVRHARLPANTAAYAISLAGARKLRQPGVRAIPIDMEFRYAWCRHLDIYGVFPAVVSQRRSARSTIDGSGEGKAAGPAATATPRARHQKPNLISQARGMLYVAGRLGLRALGSRLTGNSDGRWVYPERA